MSRPLKYIGLLACVSLIGAAHAARAGTLPGDPTVLYSESTLATNDTPSVTTLDVPGPGEIFLTLTDLSFPAPFASLKFALTDTESALVGLAPPGTLTLDLTKPTTLYAEVFQTVAPATGMGLYNLTATYLGSSPVPLPASGLLLGGGLLTLLLAQLAGPARRPACGFGGHQRRLEIHG
ncbi:MAG TPA: hypothetical protein VMD56_05895 [Steroidobacteraceae bacterium]|nr:hypothetical protein [Steroidobacteraceae bacterium]